MIEVELKYRVESLAKTKEQLSKLGASPGRVVVQTDEYFNDPIRDFRKMDLALRLRNTDEEYCLTFKGPNVDPDAKVREEIELRLDATASAQMKDVFLGIGYCSVAKVTKRREALVLDWNGTDVHLFLDDVKQVGSFIELEIIVADEHGVPKAKQTLSDLCNRMGLKAPVRTSYLELLLKSRGDLD